MENPSSPKTQDSDLYLKAQRSKNISRQLNSQVVQTLSAWIVNVNENLFINAQKENASP